MNIGEALKETRKKLHLSQTEMAGNVLTKSYYSKIERGIHEINAVDLIQILSLHHINIVDFFEKLGTKKKIIEREYWLSNLRQAYYSQNLSEVKKLKRQLYEVKTDKYTLKVLKAIVLLAEIKIAHKKLSLDEQNNMKKLIFESNEWNEDNLYLFSLCFSLWKVDEREELIKSILKKYSDIKNFPQRIQNIVSSILVNYLSYSAKYGEGNEKIILNIYTLLKNLPILPDNCFAKIMKNFYKAYFDKNQNKIQNIINFFENNDMQEIANILKVSI